MSGEEIGREQKAKRIARAFLGAMLRALKSDDEAMWNDAAKQAGVNAPSEQTKARVIELIGEIAI